MSIPYAPTSWNPTVGCTPVSEGCKNCWAMKLHNQRFEAYWRNVGSLPEQYAEPFEKIQLLPERLAQPLRWRKPHTVAVCFMGDLFHEAVSDRFITQVLDAFEEAPQHTYLFLTKRAERMRRLFTVWWRARTPAPNVWLGVTAENQRMADERIPLLLDTPAAHRWVSLEPLLGPVDLAHIPLSTEVGIDTLRGLGYHHEYGVGANRHERLDWIVAGGESGPGYRPMELDWAKDIADQCTAARVPFYMKQVAASRPSQPSGVPMLDIAKELPWT